MRLVFSAIFILLIGALLVCARYARRSGKAIGPSVARLDFALIPPLIGNLVIISSTRQVASTVGYYIYFLGLDLVMLSMLWFTLDYCDISSRHRRLCAFAYVPLGVDVVQLLLNPFTGHAFGTEPITVGGAAYYRLLPYAGQAFHRLVDYGLLAAIMVIFIVKAIRSPRIYSERYTVILAAMVITAVWETAYIFSRTPIDRAMVGFGVFGLLVYYLALFYRPLRLLDSMLAHMVSEMPEALFFFDAGGQCIWANKPGKGLAGIQNENFDPVPQALRGMFGDYDRDGTSQHEVVDGDGVRNYALEGHSVTDDRGRLIGSFLSVRDNTVEQATLQREIYRATHDSLTELYNRAGYDLLLSSLDLETTFLLLIDADGFKAVNDTYGHETGDRVLKKIAGTIRRSFREEDCICRLGGDEFVAFVAHTGDPQRELIAARINRINAALADTADGLPAISVSVGIAHGDGVTKPEELFEQADHALYQTKHRGKRGYTFYDGEK